MFEFKYVQSPLLEQNSRLLTHDDMKLSVIYPYPNSY